MPSDSRRLSILTVREIDDVLGQFPRHVGGVRQVDSGGFSDSRRHDSLLACPRRSTLMPFGGRI
jgi:hypothetical protein